jgi:uncharacterized protein YrzB (UPF0473 family)
MLLEKGGFAMDEERDDIVVLIDENGEEVEFEHIDTIEMNDNEYVVLARLMKIRMTIGRKRRSSY